METENRAVAARGSTRVGQRGRGVTTEGQQERPRGDRHARVGDLLRCAVVDEG